jgi:ATP/ADP translocase
MKFLISIILIVLNIFNIPLSILFMKAQGYYLPLWKEDKILYIALAPFYWFLFLLAFIIGHACETLSTYMD